MDTCPGSKDNSFLLVTLEPGQLDLECVVGGGQQLEGEIARIPGYEVSGDPSLFASQGYLRLWNNCARGIGDCTAECCRKSLGLCLTWDTTEHETQGNCHYRRDDTRS